MLLISTDEDESVDQVTIRQSISPTLTFVLHQCWATPIDAFYEDNYKQL